MLVDSHCHIHDLEFFKTNRDQLIENAKQNGVQKMIVIGTDEKSSLAAIEFANKHEGVFCTVGSHPHEAKHGIDYLEKIDFSNPKIVGIGEIGLDYYYNHSDPEIQKKVLKKQIEIAIKHNLPISFHIRDAFDDLWPILDQFKGQKIRGVMHSFTDNLENLNRALDQGFYVGVNGILTFNKNQEQLEAIKTLPLDRMLFETDAPFLAPKPYRGKQNQPAYIKNIAEFAADFYEIDLDDLAQKTTKNVEELFGI